MDNRKEIERLYALEYGRLGELAFRYISLGISASILFAYTGWNAILWWIVGFASTQILYFRFLNSRPEECTDKDARLGGVMFLVVLASFLWLPALLVAEPDPALAISGAAMFGSALIYLIFRADRMLFQVWGEIVLIAAMCGLTLVRAVSSISDPLAQLGVMVSVVVLAIYFSINVLTARQARLDAEAAAMRTIQAQKMEAIGQLTGGIAHDFNNILTALIGNLELYEVVPDPEERDRFVAESHAAARRAAGLVQQLLAYSRKSTMSIAQHDASLLIEEVCVLTRRMIPASIAVRVEAMAPLLVAVDQAQFMTALVNLLLNARDVMPGGGELTIRATCEDRETPLVQLDGHQIAAGRYVCVEVMDTGPGIPVDILRRVTEPFFTTKPVGQGSGLGLSMVEGFARQSHGALSIDSTDSGTTVRLHLPWAGVEAEAQTVTERRSAGTIAAAVSNRTSVILPSGVEVL